MTSPLPPTTASDAELVAEWRAAMEGVPAGPWKWCPWHVEEGPPTVYVKDGWLLCAVPADDHAKWIARCSPSGIASLLDRLDKLSAEVAAKEREAGELAEEDLAAEASLDMWRRRTTAAEAEAAGLRADLTASEAREKALRAGFDEIARAARTIDKTIKRGALPRMEADNAG